MRIAAAVAWSVLVLGLAANAAFACGVSDPNGEYLRRVTLIGSLPSGSRVYFIDLLQFKNVAGDHAYAMPPSAVVSFDGDRLVWRDARDGRHEASGVRFACRLRQALTHVVKPGQQVPASLLGLEPDYVAP